MNFPHLTVMENERDIRQSTVAEAGRLMMMAARTAPKGKGVDIVEIVLLDKRDELEILAAEMRRHAESKGLKFFLRDAANVLAAQAVLLIGTPERPLGLNCGYCGYAECDLKPAGVPCAFNSIDLGIAVGSACSKAADLRVDSRVMYSAGTCAAALGWPRGCRDVIAILLSASSKSPFFDRG